MMGLAGLPFEFFDAVNGADLCDHKRQRHYDAALNHEHFKRPLSRSEVGCYLSHLELWDQIGAQSTGAALVLEDDAQIDDGLKTFLKQISKYDLEDVYLKLDGVAEAVDPGDTDTTKMTLGRRKVINAAPIAPRTTGYIIGAHAARKMALARASFFRPVDIDIKHYWEHDVPVWTVAPQLVCEARSKGDESTIEESRKQIKGANPLWRFWKNTTYQYNYLKQRRMHPPVASRLIPVKN
jgi:glycosyl transferase family 25